MVYVNQNKQKFFENEDNNVVYELVKDYNSNVLQDCLKHKLLENSHGHYTLSELGNKVINNLGLSNSTLDSLSESTVLEAKDHLNSGSDYRPKVSS